MTDNGKSPSLDDLDRFRAISSQLYSFIDGTMTEESGRRFVSVLLSLTEAVVDRYDLAGQDIEMHEEDEWEDDE